MYSNSWCSCSFEPEIMKIDQSSHKVYGNNILDFQKSTTMLNTCTKKSLETYWIHHIYIYIYMCVCVCVCVCVEYIWCINKKSVCNIVFKRPCTHLFGYVYAISPLVDYSVHNPVYIYIYIGLWVNRRADGVLQPCWGNLSRRRRGLPTPPLGQDMIQGQFLSRV